jgi:hypothetical protein
VSIGLDKARLFLYLVYRTRILKELQRVGKKIYFLTICSLSKMGELKYLSGGQNKNKNLFWNKILF